MTDDEPKPSQQKDAPKSVKKKTPPKIVDPPRCGKRGTRNYYRYYDTPDGCDMDKKMMATTRYGVVTGLIAGTYDVLMYSHVVGFMPIMKRYARHAVPLGLMGATFAAVANSVQHARNADDPLNYFFGGLACGPLVALYLGSGHGVVAGGIFLGLIGVVKKEAIDAKYSFIPKFPNHMNTISSWRNDWTLVADPRDAMIHTCDLAPDGDDTEKKKIKNKTEVC